MEITRQIAARALRHENVLTLSINLEAGFLQRLNGAQMIYAGKFRHKLGRHHFHFANFAARLGLAIEIDIAANRVFDIRECFFDISAL